MQISIIDLSIILGYFGVAILIGILVSRRAVKSLNSYFLGGNKLPWWMLGVSNASGMFDITGTMWLVYVLFVYGFKSVWLPGSGRRSTRSSSWSSFRSGCASRRS